jgi:hypothetical protein
MSDTFPVQNSVKQGVALTPLLFNFNLECTIYEGPGKSGETEIKWDTLASGLCW